MVGRGAQMPWLTRSVSDGTIRLVAQAQVKVDAAAGAVGFEYRGKNRTMTEAGCGGADELANDDRVVGGSESRRGGDSYFELTRTILGKKGFGREAGSAQGRS